MTIAACGPAGSPRTASPSSAAVVTSADAVMSSSMVGWSRSALVGRCGDSVTGGRFPPPLAMLPAIEGDHHTCPPTGDPQDRRAAEGAAGARWPAGLATVGAGPSAPG